MGGTLAAEPTPGGGLTMAITLPLWPGVDADAAGLGTGAAAGAGDDE